MAGKSVVIGRVSVRVVPDLSGFARETLRELKVIEKKLPAIKVEAELDASKVRAELDALEKQRREVGIKPVLDKKATVKTRAELRKAFPDRYVDIRPRVNKTATTKAAAKIAKLMGTISGSEFLRSFGQPLLDAFKNLGTTAVPTFAAITMGVNGLAGALLTASANLAVLSQDLARIGPLALVLPGLFASLAVGLGASYAVFKDFNKVIPELGDQLQALQDNMSASFWAKAEAPIRGMIDTLFPDFEAGILRVTDALAGFYGKFATALSGRLDGGVMTYMFQQLALSIEEASRFTDSFAAIIAELGIIGTKYLPDLARWFGEVATSFAGWLVEARNSGQVFDWIERAKTNLFDLWTVLTSTVTIFDNLADAARNAGGMTLGELANDLERIAVITGTTGFQTGLTGMLIAARTMMEEIARIAGPSVMKLIQEFAAQSQLLFPSIGRSIGFLTKLIADAFTNPAFTEGFGIFVAGLETGLGSLSQSGGDLGAVLGGLKTIMGAIAAGAGPLLASALGILADIIGPLSGTVAGIFLFGFTSLKQTLDLIAPLIPPIVTAFNNFLLALQPLAEAVMPVFQAILVKVLEVLPGIMASVTGLVGAMTALWQVIGPLLIPVFQFLITVIANSVKGLIDGFKTVIEGVTVIISNVIDLVRNVFAGEWRAAWENIKNILKGVLLVIIGAIQVWWNASVLGFLKGGLLRLAGMWKGGWTGIWTALKGILSGIKGSISGAWTGFRQTISAGMTAISQTARAAWTTIKTVFTTSLSAIRTAVSTAISAVKTTFSSGLSAAKSVVSSGISTMKSTFTSGMSAIKTAVSTGVSRVLSTFRGLPSGIRSALGNLGGLLRGAGQAVIQGFLNGINNMIGSVRSKLGELTSMIPSWKGPYKKDKVLLVDAGQAIMQSLIDGFKSRFGDVRKSLTSLTDEIGGMEVDGPTVGAASIAARRRVLAAQAAAREAAAPGGGTFNYYAAPGSSIGSEEDLFGALDRRKAWGF